MNEERIKNLISLLDDENPHSAGFVMAELLAYEDEIDLILQKFQETENARLRKRIHQLESIVLLRRRRKSTATKIKNSATDVIHGLTELHLLWYDNDSDLDILKNWEKLLDNSRNLHPDSIEKLSIFMKRSGFTVSGKDDIEADYYCLGMVLEELVGADFILCAIAVKIAETWGLELKILQLFGDFALIDKDGKLLFPKNNWKIFPQAKRGKIREWDTTMILKLTSSMLFLGSMATDSFRYINTTGTCLAKSNGLDTMEFLPYPYNFKTDQK